MIEVLSKDNCADRLEKFNHPAQKNYLAFYSSILGGITIDKCYMSIPVDDHVVHRGDGVFEALKCLNGNIYLWQAHLNRLCFSAKAIGLKVPENILEIVKATILASKAQNCIVRIFLTRGPGQFSNNPYDSIGEQLYVMITKWTPVSENKIKNGATLGRSSIPPKEKWLAQLKTCNYLPNVMMKKEAVDRNFDFTIGFDKNGIATEGGTESIAIVTKNRVLQKPQSDSILRGTRMDRLFTLSDRLIEKGLIKKTSEADFVENDLLDASEILILSSVADILACTSYENQIIGDGLVGPVAKEMLKMMLEDQISGSDHLKVF